MSRTLILTALTTIAIVALSASAVAEWPPGYEIRIGDVRVDFGQETDCLKSDTRFRVDWTLSSTGSGPYPPFAMTIGRWAVDAEAGSASFPCNHVLWLLGGGTVPPDGFTLVHGVLYVPVQVVDSRGVRATTEVPIPVVPPPPARTPTKIQMVVGATELFVVPDGRRYGACERSGQLEEITLGRHRPVGGTDWTYFTACLGVPQSSWGSLSRHASGLRTNVLYELQLAYVWHGADTYPRHGEYPWRWWQWNDPTTVRWSETWRFRTHGAETLTAETTADSITVTWPWADDRGRPEVLLRGYPHYRVTARSAAWPGVVWRAPRVTHPQPSQAGDPGENVVLSSTISGLPPNTDFTISVALVPPYGFSIPAGASIAARTKHSADTRPGVADPSDVAAELNGGELIVRWTCDERSIDWVTLRERTRPATWDGPRRFSSWDLCPEHESIPADERRVEASFGQLQPGKAYRLYVNRRADRTFSTPFTCMTWDIVVPPVQEHAYLDRQLHSEHGGGVASINPAPIPPLSRYLVQHEECWLREPGYP